MNLDGPKLGESPIEAEYRLRPFTSLVLYLFLVMMIGGLIWSFAFSDAAAEMWRRAIASIAVVGPSAVLLFYVRQREEEKPFSLAVRRFAWRTIIYGYIAAAALVVVLVVSPFAPKLQVLRLLIALGMISPLPILAWRFLKTE